MIKMAKGCGVCCSILLMGMVVLMFLAPRFGWRVDAVLSGSMEPALKSGGIAVTRPVSSEDIVAGDIITFVSPASGELTSHRVILVTGGIRPLFHTQGDANKDADPYPVPAASIVGRVCFHLALAGYAAMFIKTPLGLVLTLVVPGIAVIIMEMVNIWRTMSDIERIKAEAGQRR